jgi:hypothetical protein
VYCTRQPVSTHSIFVALIVVFLQFYLYFVGFCLPDLYWFEHLVETFVNDLELVPLSSRVPDLNSNGASIASASF